MRQVRLLNWHTVFNSFCLCANRPLTFIEICWTKHEDKNGRVVFDSKHNDGKKCHKIPYLLNQEFFQFDAAKRVKCMLRIRCRELILSYLH